ncbi:hypothetical protein Tco_0773593 [Tanacetum coccineum]|uniref:Uncharacterized protein n=1 Tax=Tanacetum coccineum TaxID=301880 RepID=A0ABQ4ZPV0_9ASTR
MALNDICYEFFALKVMSIREENFQRGIVGVGLEEDPSSLWEATKNTIERKCEKEEYDISGYGDGASLNISDYDVWEGTSEKISWNGRCKRKVGKGYKGLGVVVMQIQRKDAESCFKNNSLEAFTLSVSEGLEKGYDEREVPAGFADEVIYSLFAKQSEDLDLLHEDLKQIDDMDIEEMDINWQIAMIAIRMKKFYKKTGRRVWIDGNKPVGFDKKKLECFKCHNTGHFEKGMAHQ